MVTFLRPVTQLPRLRLRLRHTLLHYCWCCVFCSLGRQSWGRGTQPWDEKDAAAVEEEFSLEDLFGDDAPAGGEL